MEELKKLGTDMFKFCVFVLLFILPQQGLAVSNLTSDSIVKIKRSHSYLKSDSVQRAASDLKVRQIKKLADDSKWLPKSKFVKKQASKE